MRAHLAVSPSMIRSFWPEHDDAGHGIDTPRLEAPQDVIEAGKEP
jgi:hypothetical protein